MAERSFIMEEIFMPKNVTKDEIDILQPYDPTFGYFDGEDSVCSRLLVGSLLAGIALGGSWAIWKTENFLKEARATTVNKFIRVEGIMMIYSKPEDKSKTGPCELNFVYFQA